MRQPISSSRASRSPYPPELLATFDSEGAYLPLVVPPNTRMFALPAKHCRDDLIMTSMKST